MYFTKLRILIRNLFFFLQFFDKFFSRFKAKSSQKNHMHAVHVGKKITCTAEKSHARVHVNQRNYQHWTHTDKICDLIILIAKFYIYRCKVQNKSLNINIFIKELYRRYQIEKSISKDSNLFKNNWTQYETLFKGILIWK